VSSVLTLHYSMLAVTFQTKVTWSASSIWRSPSGTTLTQVSSSRAQWLQDPSFSPPSWMRVWMGTL